MSKPESWNEVCLVSLNDGTTDMNIAPIMNSISINQGGRPVESVATLSGGRILNFKPEEDTEIEFEGISYLIVPHSAIVVLIRDHINHVIKEIISEED